MAEQIIVIGGTAAGLSAASKAKRMMPDCEITVYEKSGYISYGACGLPYFVGDLIKEAEELISLTPQAATNRGLTTFIHHEAVEIHPSEKTVRVKNLDTDESFVQSYDKLVIATGASPVRPSLPGVDADGVYCLRTVEDGIALKAAVQSRGKRAVIVGGGFIGLEVAEEMAQCGIAVDLFEVLPRLLPFLPEAFSDQVAATLEKNGVTLHTGVAIQSITTQDGKVTGVMGSDGSQLETDFILLSIGVRPASALAEQAGLTLGLKGGILVDDHLQTSDPSIWACGDCVQMKHLITGDATYVPLGTTANKQGRIAGTNLAGGDDTFKGVLGSSVTKVFETYIAITGLSLTQAMDAGYDAVSQIITKLDRASYYPGGIPTQMAMVMDRKTGRLLGAQAIGGESVAGRINVLACAITCGMTVPQINELDLVYAPPVAPVYDPILIAASQTMKYIGG